MAEYGEYGRPIGWGPRAGLAAGTTPAPRNDRVRRLDEQPADGELREGFVAASASSGSGLTAGARRILEAINGLPACPVGLG